MGVVFVAAPPDSVIALGMAAFAAMRACAAVMAPRRAGVVGRQQPFLAGRRLGGACSNRTVVKTAAFFNFNYMGMLATEGTYDRMYDLMKGRHPCDVILLM